MVSYKITRDMWIVFMMYFISVNSYTEMVDFPGLGKSDQSEKSVLDSPAHLETSSVESLQTPLQPHGKWSIVESVESPEGIKIKLNRRRCSKAAPPSTRISRKQANEVNIFWIFFKWSTISKSFFYTFFPGWNPFG